MPRTDTNTQEADGKPRSSGSVNRVILVGNLTRDGERIATSGKAMTRLRIATNSWWRDSDGNRQEAAEFHSVVTFGPLAEVCAQHCSRGRRVYVEGRLRTREYVGADMQRRMTTEIVAETVRVLTPRRQEDHPEGDVEQ